MKVLRAPSPDKLEEEIREADIVEVQFWNSPPIYQRLRGHWPPARLLVRCHVLGLYPPQVLTRQVVEFADACAVSSPATLERSDFQETPTFRSILSPADMTRVEKWTAPLEHEGVRVGYVGTVNFAKLHPRFVEMCRRISPPDIRFVVYGTVDQAVREQIEESGDSRFELKGYQEQIGPEFAAMDVFGYPLGEKAYATSEKSLQEAMYVGVPPVVLDHPSLRHLVVQNQTGLIAAGLDEYVDAVEYLYRRPEERIRLGKGAREKARSEFRPELSALRFDDLYREMMKRPKRSRRWTGVGFEGSGADQFIESLGDAGGDFEVSRDSSDTQSRRLAEERIKNAPIHLSNGEGGIMHYRNAFSDDPWLRFWSGLVLLGQDRVAESREEFQAAALGGLESGRCEAYLQTAGERLSE